MAILAMLARSCLSLATVLWNLTSPTAGTIFFQIYAGQSNLIKCLYFNISRPAVFYDDRIEWEDLSLDLLVYPDGLKQLLDLDEFALLNIDEKNTPNLLADHF